MQVTVQSSKQNLGIENAPHLRDSMTTQKIMLIVLLALAPAFGVMCYFYGMGVLVQLSICSISAILFEIIIALLRHRKIKHHLSDLSYLITAALMALTLPPLLPWYLTVVATAFAILIVKHAFGGLGMNIFNPAMAGFIFLVIATPSVFYSTYIPPTHKAYDVIDTNIALRVVFNDKDPVLVQNEIKSKYADTQALTGATYLESLKTLRKANETQSTVHADFKHDAFDAYIYLAIAYSLAGIVLIALKIIHYHMPLAFLLTIACSGALYHLIDPSMSISYLEHLLLGGTMLCAFFIITDPVTNAGTLKGRIVFSILVGFLVIIIRVNGSYSDSVAFAVLLGNAAAPLIDVLMRRRKFGVNFKEGSI